MPFKRSNCHLSEDDILELLDTPSDISLDSVDSQMNCAKVKTEDAENVNISLKNDREDSGRLDHDNVHQDIVLWFNQIKSDFNAGILKLERRNPIDEKLIFSFEAKSLSVSEMLRTKNIFEIWKQHKLWDSDCSSAKVDDSLKHHDGTNSPHRGVGEPDKWAGHQPS